MRQTETDQQQEYMKQSDDQWEAVFRRKEKEISRKNRIHPAPATAQQQKYHQQPEPDDQWEAVFRRKEEEISRKKRVHPAPAMDQQQKYHQQPESDDQWEAVFRGKEQEVNRKSRIHLTLATGLALVVLATAGGKAFAELSTTMPPLDNELTFGRMEIIINEKFDGWDIKEVSLTVTEDSVDSIVRMMLVPYVLDAEGVSYVSSDLGEFAKPLGGKMILGDITLEFASDWETYWFYKDGYFYYRQVLEPGKTTPVLLKKVSLTNDTDEMKEKYADTTINIEILSSALQAEGDSAKKWDITVMGSTVSP